jgi:hypothetical protein
MKNVSLEQCVEAVELDSADLASIHGGNLWRAIYTLLEKLVVIRDGVELVLDVYGYATQEYAAPDETYFDPFIS